VASDADLTLAARRIIWAKCLNAGQTGIAPDYVLYAGKIREKLIAKMNEAIKEFFGEVHNSLHQKLCYLRCSKVTGIHLMNERQ